MSRRRGTSFQHYHPVGDHIRFRPADPDTPEEVIAEVVKRNKASIDLRMPYGICRYGWRPGEDLVRGSMFIKIIKEKS